MWGIWSYLRLAWSTTRAELAFSEKRWKDAIQEYSKAIEKTPENIDLYQKRSRAYFSEKQYLKCVDDLHKIEEIDPTRQPQKIEILAYQKEIQRLKDFEVSKIRMEEA